MQGLRIKQASFRGRKKNRNFEFTQLIAYICRARVLFIYYGTGSSVKVSLDFRSHSSAEYRAEKILLNTRMMITGSLTRFFAFLLLFAISESFFRDTPVLFTLRLGLSRQTPFKSGARGKRAHFNIQS